MPDLQEKRLQKRFAGFLISYGLIFGGLFAAPPDVYSIYAMMVSGIYAAYLGGQSLTDWQKAKNSGST